MDLSDLTCVHTHWHTPVCAQDLPVGGSVWEGGACDGWPADDRHEQAQRDLFHPVQRGHHAAQRTGGREGQLESGKWRKETWRWMDGDIKEPLLAQNGFRGWSHLHIFRLPLAAISAESCNHAFVVFRCWGAARSPVLKLQKSPSSFTKPWKTTRKPGRMERGFLDFESK